MSNDHIVNKREDARIYENSPEYLRDVLKYIVDIGSSLRLQTDIDIILKRVVTTSCKALRFRYAVLYLIDNLGLFRVVATSGLRAHEEAYLEKHPLPASIVARIVDEHYRISDSYFLPAESPIWQDEEFSSYFVVVNPLSETLEPTSLSSFAPISSNAWLPEDMMVVPLISGDNQLLGFLIPDGPLNELRPTRETMSLFELFTNQAAVVIEGARLSTELRKAVQQARDSERVKNNFLMTASHELRTPLTAVQGYLDLLADYKETLDEASQVRFIQNARRGCDELVLLLGNVMDVTHLDVEKIAFKPGPVYLQQSAYLILEILEPIITREKRAIELQIADELSVWIDELRLRQVLLNLLSNALKYTPAGSPIALTVHSFDTKVHQKQYKTNGHPKELVQLERHTGNFIVLAIRDWGAGVPPADQPLLFNKFTRLETARIGPQRGAGLGLYLCRQLIEAMGGLIWMESSGIIGEGATFFLALPEYKP